MEHFALVAGFAPNEHRFSLGKRVDIDKLALIAQEGVHKLKLNAVAHAVSVDEAERPTVRKKVTGVILDEIKHLLALEEAVPVDAENLKVEVSLSFDKRNGTELDRESLQQLAEAVLGEDDDGFEIER